MKCAVDKASEKMATLDDSGIAFAVIQCENEADILRVVSTYRYKGIYKGQYPVKYKIQNLTRDSKVTAQTEMNMYEVSGTNIREYKTQSIGEMSFDGRLLKKLSTAVYDPCPQLIYIRNIFDLIGGPQQERSTEQTMYLDVLKDIGLAKQMGKNKVLVVIACTDGVMCNELEAYSFILNVPHLENEEIRAIICKACKENMQGDYVELLPALLNELTEAFRGFREDHIRNTIELAFASQENPLINGAAELFKQIREIKKQILKKTGGLEWRDRKTDKIAGLEFLTEWVASKKILFQYYAACTTHNITIPKGVLVSGIPGTGKSLMAKNVAKILDIPLVKMDIGSLMGKYQGESEANISRAIALAEAISPCVLWLDELEKSFAGVSGKSDNNETIMRAFSSFLTWLQDKEKPCFVFATANNVNNLPPEFLRKGRFDEKFMVFMPTKAECRAILQTHFEKKKKCFKIYSHQIINHIINGFLEECARRGKFLNGADIAAIVESTFQALFVKAFTNMTNEQRLLATTKLVITFNDYEIEEAILSELSTTKTYGENLKSVCEYWLSLVDNPFREASAPYKCTHRITYESYVQDTGEFKNLGKTGDEYDAEAVKLLDAAKKTADYDECFNLSMLIEIKKLKTERSYVEHNRN